MSSGGDEYPDYSEFSAVDVPSGGWRDVVESLQAVEASEADRIRDELERVEGQLRDREGMHEEVVDDLRFRIEKYESEVEHMEGMFRGSEEDRRRLRDQVRELRGELRAEHRRFWRDRQELEEQRRRLLRELAEVEDADLSELV